LSIDFTAVLRDFDDRPIRDEIAMASAGTGAAPIDLTLGRAAAHALCASFEDERNISGEKKFERGMLAVKVRDATDVELKSEQVTIIKQALAKLYGPVVIYRAYPLLDPSEKA
jgi:hypothetical protein